MSEYSVAMKTDEWNTLNAKMLSEFGDEWENLRDEADRVIANGEIALRWDDFPGFGDLEDAFKDCVDEVDDVDSYDIGEDPLNYGINRCDCLGSTLVAVEAPMAILQYKELYLPEAERIIRAMAKELPTDKVKAIFKEACYSREYGIEPVIRNYTEA